MELFPPPRALPPLPAALRARGIALPPARKASLPLLRLLFAASHMADLALTPWTKEEKQSFLHRQFALQHEHFIRVHAKADFRLITQDEKTIGRFYFDRSGPEWVLVDILLTAPSRGGGIGSALIAWLQGEALRASTEKMRLSVARNNPRARSLYLRHAFAEAGSATATHTCMIWHADAPKTRCHRQGIADIPK